MKRRFAFRSLWILGFAWLAWSAECQAQPAGSKPATSDGISVYGVAELTARPNVVEIDFRVTGKAELTADALVKYRDAKKRVLESLDKLKSKNISIEEHGLTISAGSMDLQQQQRILNGQQQAPAKPQIEVSSTMRIKLKEVRDIAPEELIKTVGKLLDVAQDSGILIGPNQADLLRNMRMGLGQGGSSAPVKFVVADAAEIREKVYEQAVADARDRAKRLAKLHQVRLGPAVSIQEVPSTTSRQAAYSPYYPFGLPQQDDGDDGESGTSTMLSEISLKVKLLVRFAIETPPPATAQQ
ncbi:MAG: SIMPL domain-containing protein [Planctomycetia bacterium]|nr:SIMPL domain-containing protein [Planctomycetia bacterium]